MSSLPKTAVVTGENLPKGGGYAELFAQVREAGLMDRRRARYLVKIVATALVFGAVAIAFVMIGDSWW